MQGLLTLDDSSNDKTLQPLDARPQGPGGPGGAHAAWGAPPTWSNSGAPTGGRTPFSGSSSKTPNPYAAGDGKTPAWNAASRTPNPYADNSGKTPAWNASSRTPNPYAANGGQTPAWNVSSRTPNPYATGANAGAGTGTGWGGATPARSSWGDPPGQSSWGGGDTPRASNTWGDSWGVSVVELLYWACRIDLVFVSTERPDTSSGCYTWFQCSSHPGFWSTYTSRKPGTHAVQCRVIGYACGIYWIYDILIQS